MLLNLGTSPVLHEGYGAREHRRAEPCYLADGAKEHLATLSKIDWLTLANQTGIAHDRGQFVDGLFCSSGK
jgi:hypothetical protein